MSKLFNKVCTLTIGDRQYTCPPFDVEFDQKIGGSPVTEVKLYNPNEDTITAVSKISSSGIGPLTIINAGYKELRGDCANGYITSFNVKKEQIDKVLTFHIMDAANKIEKIINKTYISQNAESVLKDLLSLAGVSYEKIQLGLNNVNYKTFTAKAFGDALKVILADTESKDYYNNGIMTIQPKSYTTKPNWGYVLSKTSGLINVPERSIVLGMSGIRFQTLFLYNLYQGSIFKMDSKNVQGTYQVIVGKKKFSSFQKTICDFEAIPV